MQNNLERLGGLEASVVDRESNTNGAPSPITTYFFSVLAFLASATAAMKKRIACQQATHGQTFCVWELRKLGHRGFIGNASRMAISGCLP